MSARGRRSGEDQVDRLRRRFPEGLAQRLSERSPYAYSGVVPDDKLKTFREGERASEQAYGWPKITHNRNGKDEK